ncbi:MAG TPA: NUDIX domain-containing protein [Opitutaceae bacterium]|nr:NUDIX domain-containing protein [Opitutaceae bacterium]
MPKQSAGLLLHRRVGDGFEVFLVHPGGPLWAKKDLGAWTIPKGEFTAEEDPLAAAQRELKEETGLVVVGPFVSLGCVKQAGGKVVHAWAAEADCDPATIVSNTFSLEWPPRSGQKRDFPEVDRAAWFAPDVAAEKINPAQAALIARLADALGLARG